MSSEWDIALLGTQRVLVDTRHVDLGGPRQERLLAVLALEPNQTMPFSGLVDALWDDDPPDTARRQVHNAITALRRALGPMRGAVVTAGRGYRLDIAADRIDTHRFAMSVARARRAIAEGRREDAIAALADGLALWRGPALAGLSGRTIRVAAARLDEERLAAIELLFGLRLDTGAAVDIIPALRNLVEEHPLRDPFREKHMLALYRAGRQAEALDVFDRGRVLLADELGLDMRAEARQLHGRILRADPTLDAPKPAPPKPDQPQDDRPVTAAPAPDRGGRPARETAGPRPDAEPNPVGDRCFLPRDIRDFTGRDEEFQHLVRLVEGARQAAPIIAVIDGMAGIGKTALALHVAHSVAEHYPDGQFFIDLQGHTSGGEPVDSAYALDRLLRDAGVRAEQEPHGLEQRSAVWRAALAGKRVLLVVDNALDAGHARPLLPGGGGTLVLITSRRRLPDLDSDAAMSLDVLSDADAVELFGRIVGADRAAAEPDAVADIAHLCGRLPLAIRIASSRLRQRRAWTVAHLAGRLREGERRLTELAAGDRSVATAFEVSYRQLGPRQRLLFRRLGLHPGREFDANAAAALAGPSAEGTEDLLEELFDANLLSQHVVGRYYFHDLIYRYAGDKALAEEPAAERSAALDRLCEYYLTVARHATAVTDPGLMAVSDEPPPAAVAGLVTPADVAGFLAAERSNFTAVIGAVAASDPGKTWRLTVAVGPLLVRDGYPEEALADYEVALRAASSAGDRSGEAEVRLAMSAACRVLGKYQTSIEHLNPALELFQAEGDRHGEARVVQNLGHAALMLGDFEEVFTRYHAALALFREVDAAQNEAVVLGNIGVVHGYLARYRDALGYHEMALARSREFGSPYREAVHLLNIGWIHSRLGDAERARDDLHEALARTQRIGAREVEVRVRWAIGDHLHRAGDQDGALGWARESLALAREIKGRDVESQALNLIGAALREQGGAEDARKSHESALTIATELGLRFEQAVAYEGLARLSRQRGDLVAARAYADQAVDLFSHMYPGRAAEVQELRAALDVPR